MGRWHIDRVSRSMAFIARSRNLVASLLARARLVTALLVHVLILVLIHRLNVLKILNVEVIEVVTELKRLDWAGVSLFAPIRSRAVHIP